MAKGEPWVGHRVVPSNEFSLGWVTAINQRLYSLMLDKFATVSGCDLLVHFGDEPFIEDHHALDCLGNERGAVAALLLGQSHQLRLQVW